MKCISMQNSKRKRCLTLNLNNNTQVTRDDGYWVFYPGHFSGANRATFNAANGRDARAFADVLTRWQTIVNSTHSAELAFVA